MASANRLNRHTVHICLELGPTLKAVASGNYELRVVQREFGCIGCAVMRVDLRNGLRLAGYKTLQQLLRLALQLFEIRMLAHPAGG